MSRRSRHTSPFPWAIKDNVGVVTIADADGNTIMTFAGSRSLRLANAKFVLSIATATAGLFGDESPNVER